MKLRKPFMNYKNDLDECLTYFNLIFNFPNFRLLFTGLPNLLSHFNWLLDGKVPKLLENYGNRLDLEHTRISIQPWPKISRDTVSKSSSTICVSHMLKAKRALVPRLPMLYQP